MSLESADSESTLPGDCQEPWLLDGLGGEVERALPVALFARRGYRDRRGQRFDMDTWDGYSGSRDRIVESIAEGR